MNLKLLEKCALLTTVLFLSKLIYAGELALLIHPRYFWLVDTSVVVLAVILLFDRRKVPLERNIVALCAALTILFGAGLFIQLKPLSSLAQKPTSLSNVNVNLSRMKRSTDFAVNTEERRLQDWVTLFSINPEPTKYDGQRAKVSGFYYTSPEGYPMIARYTLSCCAADARIIGIHLSEPLDYDENTWIQIEGTFQATQKGEDRFAAINITHETTIEIPENPYVIN